MDYLHLIQKYISPQEQHELYRIYVIHVTLVTKKALEIATQHSLSPNELRFIEEASMLHDLGIFRVNAPDIACHGELPYIQHVLEGARILREEGYPEHARVAETHTGVGILAEDIRTHALPLPEQDWIPDTLAAEIIAFADLFYSKIPGKLWHEKSVDEVRSEIARYGQWHQQRLEQQMQKFLV